MEQVMRATVRRSRLFSEHPGRTNEQGRARISIVSPARYQTAIACANRERHLTMIKRAQEP